MPGQEIAYLWQQAVLWPCTGYDQWGEPTVGAPVQLGGPGNQYAGVRWDGNKTQMQDPKGNLITLDASVMVAFDISIGSHLWLGTLADWYGTGTGSGWSDSELMEVKAVATTPDIKNRWQTRKLGLMRLHGRGGD